MRWKSLKCVRGGKGSGRRPNDEKPLKVRNERTNGTKSDQWITVGPRGQQMWRGQVAMVIIAHRNDTSSAPLTYLCTCVCVCVCVCVWVESASSTFAWLEMQIWTLGCRLLLDRGEESMQALVGWTCHRRTAGWSLLHISGLAPTPHQFGHFQL